jgi:hypothetical protein
MMPLPDELLKIEQESYQTKSGVRVRAVVGSRVERLLENAKYSSHSCLDRCGNLRDV